MSLKRANLSLPLYRKRLHHCPHRQPLRLPPCQDRLHDLRRQQRHAQHPADVGRVDVLGVGDFLDGREVASLQQLAPAEAAGEGLEQGAVDPFALGAGAAVMPSGVMTSFRPPRLRMANGTVTVTVCSVMQQLSGSCRPCFRPRPPSGPAPCRGTGASAHLCRCPRARSAAG